MCNFTVLLLIDIVYHLTHLSGSLFLELVAIVVDPAAQDLGGAPNYFSLVGF